jgi:hypothetical protein
VARFKTDHASEVSERTWQIYEEAIAYFREVYTDDFPIAQFDIDRASALKKHLILDRPRPLGPSTVSMALRALRAIFNHGVRPLKWISDHGLLDLEIPKHRRAGARSSRPSGSGISCATRRRVRSGLPGFCRTAGCVRASSSICSSRSSTTPPAT